MGDDTAQDTRLDADAVKGRSVSLENWNYLKAAAQVLSFLLDRLRDRQNGGYYWTTDFGGKPVKDGQRLYGQAFTIYA